MTYNFLQWQIYRLKFTGKSQYIPILIKQFIDDVLSYAKSKDLAKRSCDNIIKRTLAEMTRVPKNLLK